MKLSSMFVAFAICMLLLIGSCEDNPANNGKTQNRNPVMFSLTVFPEVVDTSDSLVVICNAMDPDADTLVYDWYTSGVVRIKGVPPGFPPELYNTFENSRIFYAPDSSHVSALQDTFRVECAARDRKGGMDVKKVAFIVTRTNR